MKQISVLICLFFLNTAFFAQEFPLKGDIYDYEVDDVIQYRTQSIGPPGWTKFQVLSKTISPSFDTVHYTMEKTTHHFDFSQGSVGTLVVGSVSTVSESYAVNDSLYNSHWCDEFTAFTSYASEELCGAIVWERIMEEICDTLYWDDYYIEGLGGPYGQVWCQFVDQMGIVCSYRELVYYNKQGLECGQLVTSLEEPEPLNLLKVFPNPVKDRLYIEVPVQAQLESFWIMNAAGMKVLNLKGNLVSVNHGVLTLDLNLDSGMYSFILTTNEGGRYSGKFLKE